MTTPISLQELKDASADALTLEQFANNPSGNVTSRLGAVYPSAAQAVADLSGMVYRGDWATGTAYALRNQVKQSGIIYICIIGHTSSTFATDLSAGRWAIFQGATKDGVETFSNKSFSGAVSFFTNGNRIGITSDATPITPTSLVQVVNKAISTGVRASSYWTGSAALPYQNHDDCLFETYNNVIDNSLNQSWSVSAPNAYNNIPAGVRDAGMRVGVYGWATTVNIPGQYVHAGTLALQIGVRGRVGFQGSGTPSTAVIENAYGVLGEVFGESTGATVQNAYAGRFSTKDTVSTIQNNVAVFAEASGGTVANFSFFGEAGTMFQKGKAIFGDQSNWSQSNTRISARGSNALEFGNPDPNGYGCNIGATAPSGAPFIAFCAEADPSSNTYRTRGRLGALIYNNLDGTMIFGRLTNNNATGQTPTESGRFTASGNLQLQETIYLRSKTPASATAAGVQGEFAWDANYLYICVATNTWKRVAVSTW